MPQTTNLHDQSRRIEDLIQRLESSADPALLAAAQELVQTVMDLHSGALDRMLEIVADAGAPGQQILDRLGHDELAGSLLALYGLHPVPLEARVAAAVENLRTARRMKAGDLELTGVEDGIVRVRLRSGGSGCGSTAASLETAVQDALRDAAPDLAQLLIDRVDESVLVSIEMLTASRPSLVKGAGL